MTLGEMMKARRSELGQTQPEAARAVGVTLRTYQGWEADQWAPRGRSYWVALCGWLGCTLEDAHAAHGRAMEAA